jgi:hypothetical protein
MVTGQPKSVMFGEDQISSGLHFPSTALRPPNCQSHKSPLLWLQRSIAHVQPLHPCTLLVSQRPFFANRTLPEGIACPSLAVSAPYCPRNPPNALTKGILFPPFLLTRLKKCFPADRVPDLQWPPSFPSWRS